MQMRDDVIGYPQKSSGIIGSRKSWKHKGRTFELLLYDSKKGTYMCKRLRQVRHVEEKETQSSVQAQTRTHA